MVWTLIYYLQRENSCFSSLPSSPSLLRRRSELVTQRLLPESLRDELRASAQETTLLPATLPLRRPWSSRPSFPSAPGSLRVTKKGSGITWTPAEEEYQNIEQNPLLQLVYASTLPVRQHPWKYVKADLDGTTLTYDCRMRLAQVMTCVRLSQGFETCFKILQLFSSCVRQSWGSCEVDLHEAIRVIWMTWLSKLYATVMSQSCAV